MIAYQDFLARKAVLARFFDKVMPEPNSGCWLWLGALTNGYGVFGVGCGAVRRAHRISYEFAKGEIPSGLDLDHKCRVRCCVNPDHLEPVTRSVNVSRGLAPGMIAKFWRTKTHCAQGHLFSGQNLGMRPNGHRYCRQCNREAMQKRRGG